MQIAFDASQTTYRDLLNVFWRSIDPTDEGGQFADRGSQYLTVIFYHNEEQKAEAEDSRDALNASGRFAKPVATRIEPAGTFYPAEEYHQEFSRKNPLRYKSYSQGSGRNACLAKLWPEPEKK